LEFQGSGQEGLSMAGLFWWDYYITAGFSVQMERDMSW